MKTLNQNGIRCDYDDRDETIGKKIRQAEIEWIPYVIVVGGEELKNKTVSLRKRLVGETIVDNKTSEVMDNIKIEELIKIINKDLEGFPRKELPIPFRYYRKRILFRQ